MNNELNQALLTGITGQDGSPSSVGSAKARREIPCTPPVHGNGFVAMMVQGDGEAARRRWLLQDAGHAIALAGVATS